MYFNNSIKRDLNSITSIEMFVEFLNYICKKYGSFCATEAEDPYMMAKIVIPYLESYSMIADILYDCLEDELCHSKFVYMTITVERLLIKNRYAFNLNREVVEDVIRKLLKLRKLLFHTNVQG